jgi:hypothetical protein
VLYSVREKEFAVKQQRLHFFAEKACAFLRRYYKESIITDKMELLPVYGQAAFRVERALALEEREPKKALELYGEIAIVYPQWRQALKDYMQVFGKAREEKEQAAKEEMRRLEAQVLSEVYNCMKEKRYEESLAILGQLKQVKPDNLAAAKLTLQIRLAMLEEA